MKPRSRIPVRFWVFENDGWVRLALRPGESLQWSKCAIDDEGASVEACKWSHTGEAIRLDWMTAGSDCDGRTRSTGACDCQLDALEAVQTDDQYNGRRIMRPDWRLVVTSRRDQFAERANY